LRISDIRHPALVERDSEIADLQSRLVNAEVQISARDQVIGNRCSQATSVQGMSSPTLLA
jgi:hypothetical protein